MSENLSVMDL